MLIEKALNRKISHFRETYFEHIDLKRKMKKENKNLYRHKSMYKHRLKHYIKHYFLKTFFFTISERRFYNQLHHI